MIVRCPHCNETNAYTDEKRGRDVHCRACQKVFFVSYEDVAAKNKESVNATTVKVKISGLAVASIILSTFLLMFLSPLFIFIPFTDELFVCNFYFGPYLALGAVVLGIAALIQRAFVMRSWWWLAIIGIAIPVMWLIFLIIWAGGMLSS